MVLFSKLKERGEERLVWGEGYSYIKERIDEAINSDGFLFILVIGERGKGKSSLALNILYNIYRSSEAVLKAIIFTPDDYDSLITKPYKELQASDGRIRAILWDDMGLHFSTYQWFLPHHRQRMIEFVENFQTVREDVAVLISTVVEADMLPPKMRSASNIMIDCQKRGGGKVFTYTRYLWFKTWKVVGEIHWSAPSVELYTKYRRMKQRAHHAKEKARVVSRSKMAKVYAEVIRSLYESNLLDRETLYGLGIIDKDGRLTPFGSYILKNSSIDISEVMRSGEEEAGI